MNRRRWWRRRASKKMHVKLTFYFEFFWIIISWNFASCLDAADTYVYKHPPPFDGISSISETANRHSIIHVCVRAYVRRYACLCVLRTQIKITTTRTLQLQMSWAIFLSHYLSHTPTLAGRCERIFSTCFFSLSLCFWLYRIRGHTSV